MSRLWKLLLARIDEPSTWAGAAIGAKTLLPLVLPDLGPVIINGLTVGLAGGAIVKSEK